jgi:hypothetical protein
VRCFRWMCELGLNLKRVQKYVYRNGVTGQWSCFIFSSSVLSQLVFCYFVCVCVCVRACVLAGVYVWLGFPQFLWDSSANTRCYCFVCAPNDKCIPKLTGCWPRKIWTCRFNAWPQHSPADPLRESTLNKPQTVPSTWVVVPLKDATGCCLELLNVQTRK